MFSGLTNQISSFMGKKGEDGSELPAQDAPPSSDEAAAAAAAAAPADAPAGSSKLEMLAGVKSQVASSMSGWLSGGIPGLNRGGAAAEADPAQQEPAATADPTARDPTSTEHVKDDDASSATGGADSGPASLAGTPTEEGAGIGAVSTKALAGAKSLGGFLYSAVNKAGKSVAEAGAKIKKTVEENKLIESFNKEQEAFIAGKAGEKGEAVAPWVGAPNEDALREECLALSTDRRNFVRSPPPGVDFAWDFDAIQPIAQATLAVDPNLENMRFELVPKIISEENFWRNYFYRVSLLRQSHEMNAMASQESTESNPQYATSDSLEQAAKKGQSGGGSGGKAASGSKAAKDSAGAAAATGNDGSCSSKAQEVKEGVAKLGLQAAKGEEDWERELEAELKDYEVVVPGAEQAAKGGKDDWDEGQIDELLKDDEDVEDLK